MWMNVKKKRFSKKSCVPLQASHCDQCYGGPAYNEDLNSTLQKIGEIQNTIQRQIYGTLHYSFCWLNTAEFRKLIASGRCSFANLQFIVLLDFYYNFRKIANVLFFRLYQYFRQDCDKYKMANAKKFLWEILLRKLLRFTKEKG